MQTQLTAGTMYYHSCFIACLCGSETLEQAMLGLVGVPESNVRMCNGYYNYIGVWIDDKLTWSPLYHEFTCCLEYI